MMTEKFLKELKIYVDLNLSLVKLDSAESSRAFVSQCLESQEIEDFITKNKKPTFSELVLKHIDQSGQADSQVYKKAGIDRRLFSKIRSNPNYRPSKHTAIAMSLALRLSEKNTENLIGSAGYTLSDSETFDLVIKFCIERKVYDIDKVNLALDYFSLKPIGH